MTVVVGAAVGVTGQTVVVSEMICEVTYGLPGQLGTEGGQVVTVYTDVE